MPSARADLAEHVVERVLLAALALARLRDEHLGERLGLLPAARCAMYSSTSGSAASSLSASASMRELAGLDGAVVLAEHLVAELAELDEELARAARGAGVLLCS